MTLRFARATWFFIFYVAFYVVLPRILHLLEVELPATFTALSYLVFAAAIIWAFRLQLVENGRQIMQRPFRCLGVIVLLLIGVMIAASLGSVLSDWLMQMLHIPSQALQNDERVLQAIRQLPRWLIIASVGVAGPFVEEFIFRFYLIGHGIQKVPGWAAVMISSVLFGLLHTTSLSLSELLGVLPHIAMALVTGTVYLITRNLVITTVAHAFVNFTSLTV